MTTRQFSATCGVVSHARAIRLLLPPIRTCSLGSANGSQILCCWNSLQRIPVADPGDQVTVSAPVIGLLPTKDMQAIVAGLDAGVDDCVAKPFSLNELVAHIHKVLRRDIWRRGETPYFSSPSLRIDLVLRRIYRSGRTLSLSRRQFQLLKLLLDADGKVLAHRDLIRSIWGSSDGGKIALLRKLISEFAMQDRAQSETAHVYSQP